MTPEELAARLEAAADGLQPAIVRAVEHTAGLGAGRIRANASGRPGPNVITGRYRSSWETVTRAVGNGALGTIGTNAPQGRRLEFGFMGMTDSLGRLYHQPPFPHVQPALPAIGETLQEQMRQAVAEVLS